MDWAETLAYGPLELKPWEFARLQPYGFYALLEGYEWRMEQYEDMNAYWVANIMNPHLRKPITPQDLLRPLRPYKTKQKNKEDENYLREKFKDALP